MLKKSSLIYREIHFYIMQAISVLSHISTSHENSGTQLRIQATVTFHKELHKRSQYLLQLRKTLFGSQIVHRFSSIPCKNKYQGLVSCKILSRHTLLISVANVQKPSLYIMTRVSRTRLNRKYNLLLSTLQIELSNIYLLIYFKAKWYCGLLPKAKHVQLVYTTVSNDKFGTAR